jgi:hypothetical protein
MFSRGRVTTDRAGGSASPYICTGAWRDETGLSALRILISRLDASALHMLADLTYSLIGI